MQGHRDCEVRDPGAAEEVDGDDCHDDQDGAGETEPDDGPRDDEAQELSAGEEQREPESSCHVHHVSSSGQTRWRKDDTLHHILDHSLSDHPGAGTGHWGWPHYLVQSRLQ